MTGLPWYRHHPRQWLDDVATLSVSEIGALAVCQNLMMARGGPIPFDTKWLRGTMGCSSRQVDSLIKALVARGLLALSDGYLSSAMTAAEIENSAKLARNAAETGAKGGRTRAESAAKTATESTKSMTDGKGASTNRDKIREEKKGVSKDTLSAGECEAVVSEWNAMAGRTGLPLVTAINAKRRSQILARLGEHGRDRFTDAIAAVEASPFCRGDVNGFRASFDFLIQPSSFLKLLEGNYANSGATRQHLGEIARHGRGDPVQAALMRRVTAMRQGETGYVNELARAAAEANAGPSDGNNGGDILSGWDRDGFSNATPRVKATLELIAELREAEAPSSDGPRPARHDGTTIDVTASHVG